MHLVGHHEWEMEEKKAHWLVILTIPTVSNNIGKRNILRSSLWTIWAALLRYIYNSFMFLESFRSLMDGWLLGRNQRGLWKMVSLTTTQRCGNSVHGFFEDAAEVNGFFEHAAVMYVKQGIHHQTGNLAERNSKASGWWTFTEIGVSTYRILERVCSISLGKGKQELVKSRKGKDSGSTYPDTAGDLTQDCFIYRLMSYWLPKRK